ncbi:MULTISPECIES: nucleoside 2-deoxyribosyltransferase [Pontibacillus]|uniref:Nucleoside 2-deoxyribosyltransferase n=1 Tax=Pontibacillus chungwhensis TaxID=265426 RepID=A0ABY8UTU4_9BACI|nr:MULTISPECIES: nucleoside 2-deoxyribosyltransferase [Pontibacillus]MCD5323374.1 nucleoside 2-deoxyribosyltransferase [Pontibacillus sp. HN14]WIF96755.1 nucleoside 2-deoxyribosyltransferase [Pontibacillus chungwhensis]
MNFYIGSGFQNKEQVQFVRDQLIQRGFIHTYDWTENERAASKEALVEIGQKEKDGVYEADLVVILLPGGKGTHIELGMALALNKTIILYAPNREVEDFTKTSTFYHLPEIQYSDSLDEVISKTIDLKRGE